MPPHSWWIDGIEQRAYARLRQLQLQSLWDGVPPVPVEHVLEHILSLQISWETIEEGPGETVFACLRPETRQVVINEAHRAKFESNPGLERFSLSHEAGHADVFALADRSGEPSLLSALPYAPVKRSSTHGPVLDVVRRVAQLSPESRTAVLQELADQERERQAQGEDSPLVRRAVDHYAAVLLMPADLLKRASEDRDLGKWTEINRLASLFVVSRRAMVIRLQELGLIFDITDNGQILLSDPSQAGQHSLF